MDDHLNTEFAVVGGGPAGALCARALRRAGADVCLVCRTQRSGKGVELLNGRARRLIEREFANCWQRLPTIEVLETTSLWNDEAPQVWNAMRSPYGAGLAIERDTLDTFLVHQARESGVRLVSGFTVRSVTHSRGRWNLTLLSSDANVTVHAKRLVLATGRASHDLLARGLTVHNSWLALATRLSTAQAASRHMFYLELVNHGWWYAIPHPLGGTYLVCCLERARRRGFRSSLLEMFSRELQQTRLVRHLPTCELGSASVTGRAMGMQTYASVHGIHWIAVGDAAFASDPLSGLGCDFALTSGLQAAQAMLDSTRAAVDQYGNWVQHFAERHRSLHARYYGVTERVEPAINDCD